MNTAKLSYEVHCIRSSITLSDVLINKIIGLSEVRQEPLPNVITDLCSGISELMEHSVIREAVTTDASIKSFTDMEPMKARKEANAYVWNLSGVIQETGEYWTYGELNAAIQEYGAEKTLFALYKMNPVFKVFVIILYLKEDGQLLLPIGMGDLNNDDTIRNLQKEYQLYKKYGYTQPDEAKCIIRVGDQFITIPHEVIRK